MIKPNWREWFILSVGWSIFYWAVVYLWVWTPVTQSLPPNLQSLIAPQHKPSTAIGFWFLASWLLPIWGFAEYIKRNALEATLFLMKVTFEVSKGSESPQQPFHPESTIDSGKGGDKVAEGGKNI